MVKIFFNEKQFEDAWETYLIYLEIYNLYHGLDSYGNKENIFLEM